MSRAAAWARFGAAALGVAALAGSRPAAADEPDPCDTAASVSPCFDADPLWLPAGRTLFAALRSPRTLARSELALALGAGFAHRPVLLLAPSPHPAGREVRVVSATSTLTLAARLGLGRNLDVGLALPFVPYQSGTGAEGVTAQRSAGLTGTTLRDPRLGFAATLLGRDDDAFALGTTLDLALPLGRASALAGAAGPTLAPGFSAEFGLGWLTFGADFGLRLRKAVRFADVAIGSEALGSLGAAVTLWHEPRLAFGVEASVRPHLSAQPAGTSDARRDLPAEWLANVRLEPVRHWSFQLAGGCGLPLARASTTAGSEAVFGVTAPSLRVLGAARYTFTL